MIYIYDLILNWCSKRKYQFFEWYEDDLVEYIKKIPIFRISNIDIIIDNDIRVGKDFLNKIYNKCEIYGNKKNEKIDYACIFCDNNNSIAVEFTEDGYSLYKSNIYILDLEDVFLLSKKCDLLDIDIEKIDTYNDKNMYLTRNEVMKKELLIEEINNSYKDNDLDKLKYFYYEIFDEEINDINIIYNKLINSLDEFNYKHDIIYDVVRIPNF